MLKTAENISWGHPDKVCDQISDAILDECLRQDPYSRVAVETMGGHGKLFILGEVTTKAKFDPEKIAREVYREIGYEDDLEIKAYLVKQSPDIAQGVDIGGAGDQGIMVGYATDETPEFLPLEHVLATKLIRRLEEVRNDKNNQLAQFLLPDGKAQVTVDDQKVKTVVLSTQHRANISTEVLRNLVITEIIKPIIPAYDYGPQIPVGGGAFSGKDASKVDRSAAYMARFLAVEYLKKYQAKEVLVKLAYAIGKKEPVMATALVDNKLIEITDYDLSPQGIVDFLHLKQPQFKNRARFGFFQDFLIS